MAIAYKTAVDADGPTFAALGVVGTGGTVIGSPTTTGTNPTADTGDAGYQFDGLTEYVYSGLNGAPNGSGPFSVEMWVMPTSGSSGGVLLGADSGVSGVTPDFKMSLGSGTDPGISILMAGGGSNAALGMSAGPPGNIRTGKWNHVVFTWDGASGGLYLNGVRFTANATLAWAPILLVPLVIAGLGEPNPTVPIDLCDVAIADVTFYNFPLSLQKVLNHMAARNGVPAYPAASSFTGSYWDIVTTDGPTAYYRCDETSGALAVDRSGNGNNGAYGLGAYTLQEPGAIYDLDEAVLLSETYSNAWDPTPAGIVTPLTSISFTSEFTLEAWVETSGTLTADATICATSGLVPSQDGPGFCFYIDTSGKLNFFMSQGGNEVAAQSPSALPTGQYNYVVVTFDTNNVVLYVNGVAVKTEAAAWSAGVWRENLCWGFRPVDELPATCQFPGELDECAIYAYPLTAPRIEQHYLAGLGPLPNPATGAIANTPEHFWEILIFNRAGDLVDIPKADIESASFSDTLNGGSTTSEMTVIRNFNNIGEIAYLDRVHFRAWNGKQPRPLNPTWNGYIVDIDQEKMRTTGKITVHMEGDQKQLDRAAVYEDINPLVDGNPSLDAADYVRHLYTVYAPPGYCVLNCPATLFPLLPGQYEMMQLGDVIDTVLKTGRDDLGNLIIWRVNADYQLVRTLLVQSDQDPNTVSGVQFKYIFVNEMCSKYTIRTKYSDITNVVTIQGGQDYITGLPVVGSYVDDDSVAEWGAWEQIVSVWSLISADACESYAESYLDTYGNAQATGEIELHNPDPELRSGVWIQCVETATVNKQMRISSVKWDVSRSRVKQTLSPTAPTPYLDKGVYDMGFATANGATNRVGSLPVNNQANFVRTGGGASA